MKRWKYTLQEGKSLRDAIDRAEDDLDSYIEVFEALSRCYLEMKNYLGAEIFEDEEYDLEEDSVVDWLRTMHKGYEALADEMNDMGYSYISEVVNEALDFFYMICDENSIWVAI